MDGNTRLVEPFQDKPSTVSMTTHFSGQQNQPCSEPKLSWQSSLSSLLHQNWDANVAHKRSSQNVGSVASVLRENLDLSLQEASCPWNSLSTYITQAAEELTPSLSSTAVQRIISLFLYWAGPSPGCGGITDDLKKPNLNPESEDKPPHKPPLCLPHIPKFTQLLSTGDSECHLLHHMPNHPLPLGWLPYLGIIRALS